MHRAIPCASACCVHILSSHFSIPSFSTALAELGENDVYNFCARGIPKPGEHILAMHHRGRASTLFSTTTCVEGTTQPWTINQLCCCVLMARSTSKRTCALQDAFLCRGCSGVGRNSVSTRTLLVYPVPFVVQYLRHIIPYGYQRVTFLRATMSRRGCDGCCASAFAAISILFLFL